VTAIATDILQSLKISLKLIVIAATVKILMSVRHVKVVANAATDCQNHCNCVEE
jgi:hypothetical protein